MTSTSRRNLAIVVAALAVSFTTVMGSLAHAVAGSQFVM